MKCGCLEATVGPNVGLGGRVVVARCGWLCDGPHIRTFGEGKELPGVVWGVGVVKVVVGGFGIKLCLVVAGFVVKDALELIKSLIVISPKIPTRVGLNEHRYANKGGFRQAAPSKLRNDGIAGT